MKRFIIKSFENFFVKNKEVDNQDDMPELEKIPQQTVIYKLKFGDPLTPPKTEGTQGNGIDLTIRNMRGHNEFSREYKSYYEKSEAIIWVITDRNDGDTDGIRDEFLVLTKKDTFHEVDLLIFSEKKDISRPINTDFICNKLENYRWKIKNASMFDGNGHPESLEWLLDQLKDN